VAAAVDESKPLAPTGAAAQELEPTAYAQRAVAAFQEIWTAAVRYLAGFHT
jgi:hypothetical protein